MRRATFYVNWQGEEVPLSNSIFQDQMFRQIVDTLGLSRNNQCGLVCDSFKGLLAPDGLLEFSVVYLTFNPTLHIRSTFQLVAQLSHRLKAT
jgi:hypothetical protein